MPTTVSFAPARHWRACLFYGLLAVQGLFGAVPIAKPPELAQVGKPSDKEAAELISQFRNSGIPGEYFLEFELQALPRRGKKQTFKGRWWGSRNEQGVLLRIEIADAAGNPHRFLLQNGEKAKVWRWSQGRVAELSVAGLMSPLVPGVEISAFDLQMPYLYWPGVSVQKITRSVLGRPAHAFQFPVPSDFAAQHQDISSMRAYLDTAYNVPVQTEMLDAKGKVSKTLSLLSIKTVNPPGQTLPKTADYFNEITRDKTRLQITGAALTLELPESMFAPGSLEQPASPPPAAQIVRIDR